MYFTIIYKKLISPLLNRVYINKNICRMLPLRSDKYLRLAELSPFRPYVTEVPNVVRAFMHHKSFDTHHNKRQGSRAYCIWHRFFYLSTRNLPCLFQYNFYLYALEFMFVLIFKFSATVSNSICILLIKFHYLHSLNYIHMIQ